MKSRFRLSLAICMMMATGALAQDSWTQKANFYGGDRYGAFFFSIGNKGYVGTGVNDAGIVKSDFWEYDPVTDVWTQKADYGAGIRLYATGFSIGNKGYAGTGSVASYDWRKDMWKYDPVLNVWTPIADFGGGFRYSMVAFTIGDRGYMGTGVYRVSPWYDAIYHDDFWEYNPATDRWTQKANVPELGRCGAIGISIGNKGYIGMGFYYYDTRKKDFWEYDPSADNWTRKADLPGTERFNPSAFTIGNKGYVGAGWYYSGLDDFWEFDPATNTWTQKASLAAVRNANVYFTIGNKGYVGMGSNSVGALSDFWEYSVIPPVHPAITFDPIQVSTYAGSGEAGLTDGNSLSAGFNYPSAVAADAIGNVYVADAGNNCIRKITAAGMVSTFAGNGIAGYADGAGTAAQFSHPFGVAVNASGDVFVADENNNRIRKITPAGMVSTFAGDGAAGFADGAPATAQFNHPQALTVAASGDLYVADYRNNRIRKLTSSGNVSTFAGDGTESCLDGTGTAAQLFTPDGVAMDSSGNLFATLFYCGGLRKITSSETVTTINTDPAHTYNTYHRGVIVDALGNVYISVDNAAHKSMIYKITPTGAGSIFAGTVKGYLDGTGIEAQFGSPVGLSVDAAGNLYVADPDNNRIRKMSAPNLHFSAQAGIVSNSQFFTVSGTNLSGNILITAPAGYEISQTITGSYTAAISVAVVAGEVDSDSIFIRLKNTLAAGSYNGNIILSADGALTKTLPVTGIVTDTVPPLVQCLPSQSLCFNAGNSYTIPAITATDISGIGSVTYSISGATTRSGTGLNASGIFNPGKNMITWTVKDNANNTTTCNTNIRINLPLSVSIPATYPLLIWGKANTIYKGFGSTCALLIAVPTGGTKYPNATYHYSWSTGATAAIVSVCPATVGPSTYTVTVTDSLGCTATASIVITVVDVRCGPNNNEVQLCWFGKYQSCYSQGQAIAALILGAKLGSCAATTARGSSDNNSDVVMNKDEIKVFPNPNNGTFVLQFNNTDAREIRILDMNGKLVEKKILNGLNRLEPVQINPAKISNGIYLVQVLTKTGVLSKTFLVQK